LGVVVVVVAAGVVVVVCRGLPLLRTASKKPLLGALLRGACLVTQTAGDRRAGSPTKMAQLLLALSPLRFLFFGE
jgi:hypothetical protein